MRMLMFHVESFWYRLKESDEADPGISFNDSLLVWIHSEKRDEHDRPSVLRKMVKNIRWLAVKNDLSSIILHPFAHLEDDKSDSVCAKELIELTAERLHDRKYEVHIVEYGVFTEFKMHVKGPSLAKVFKQF